MKICLINPPWSAHKDSNIWANIRPVYPPLSLLSLAAVLEQKGIQTDVLDLAAPFSGWQDIEKKIRQLDHDYFGITATTPIILNGYRISRMIKDAHPESRVIFGGIHPTVMPDEPFAKGMADFVIRGDGEYALARLAQGMPFCEIEGLSFKDNGKVRHIKPDALITDLDSLPFPAYHKVNLRLYRPAIGAYRRLPAINLMTTRGCIGKCTFCNSANIKLRRRSPQNILEDIRILTQRYGIKEISFYDDTFTVYPATVMKLCDMLIKNRIDITWTCFARTDCVTFDMLKAMKSAGCHQIMYGIESVREDIMSNIGKKINRSFNKKAVDMTKGLGITVRCTFMFGNPGETEHMIDETIKYSIALRPDIALYNITTPYPGTEMFRWAKENNYLITENWDDYDLSEPIMRLPTLSKETLKKKYVQAFWMFYLRPTCIARNLIRIKVSETLFFLLGVKALIVFMVKNLTLMMGRKGR